MWPAPVLCVCSDEAIKYAPPAFGHFRLNVIICTCSNNLGCEGSQSKQLYFRLLLQVVITLGYCCRLIPTLGYCYCCKLLPQIIISGYCYRLLPQTITSGYCYRLLPQIITSGYCCRLLPQVITSCCDWSY